MADAEESSAGAHVPSRRRIVSVLVAAATILAIDLAVYALVPPSPANRVPSTVLALTLNSAVWRYEDLTLGNHTAPGFEYLWANLTATDLSDQPITLQRDSFGVSWFRAGYPPPVLATWSSVSLAAGGSATFTIAVEVEAFWHPDYIYYHRFQYENGTSSNIYARANVTHVDMPPRELDFSNVTSWTSPYDLLHQPAGANMVFFYASFRLWNNWTQALPLNATYLQAETWDGVPAAQGVIGPASVAPATSANVTVYYEIGATATVTQINCFVPHGPWASLVFTSPPHVFP